MSKRPTIHIISQAHLDPVWLWQWRDGFAEALTTLQSAVDRLREFPTLRYTCSAAAVYRWVQETDPRLFAEIRALVQAGRWEVVGGWVIQADTNLPSEFGLLRQAALGLDWFREHLGVKSVPVGYCVDSFGHSAGLPTILASTGFRYYVFARPHAWNRPDLPNLFWWEGPDGQRVLALRLATSYCQPYGTSSDELEATFRKEWAETLVGSKNLGAWFLGIGNHGGGPTKAHVERMQLLQRSSDSALPEVRFSTLGEFFAALEESGALATVPMIRGELLHEFRGCYSANARFKRLYRQAEREILAAERLLLPPAEARLAGQLGELGRRLPPRQLQDAWWTLCFNQFHDILPGTSIASAYEDARDDLGSVRLCARKLTVTALHTQARQADTRQVKEGALFVLNTLPWRRSAVVELDGLVSPHGDSPITHLLDAGGEPVALQWTMAEALYGPHLRAWKRLVAVVALPASGGNWWELEHGELPGELPAPAELSPSLTAMAGSIRLLALEECADTWGYHTHAWDKILATATQDRSVELDVGPVFRRTRQWWTLGRSTLLLDVVQWPALGTIELRLRVNWQDRNQALKLELAVPAGLDRLTARTPGAVNERPWDGKEWPCLDWVALDAADGKSAVMIANDGVFAYDAAPGRLRLTILRCVPHALHDPVPFDPNSPDPFLDEGWHECRLWLTLAPGGASQDQLDRLAATLVTPVERMLDSAHPGTP